MSFIADFHVHSRYSRATSKDMEVETLARWALNKGIALLGTGDFTHPAYFAELKAKLVAGGNGLFLLKNPPESKDKQVHFILTAEVNNIFTQGGKLRKIHTMLFAPTFQVAEEINAALAKRGNLHADGRPTFSFAVKDLVRIVRDISPDILIVPAHVWTPWFSLFGANSGFDSIEECFEEEAGYIRVIETGLSSDPQMNWRLSALDEITLISNSDAHSPSKIGREANVFDCALDYYEIIEALKTKNRNAFLYTIEFFPQEGKYHYDGHRNCGVLFSPAETKSHNYICPVCGRRLTVGVMHRVESLADRPEGFTPQDAIGARHLVPLSEIIAEALSQGVNTKAVEGEYQRLILHLGSELDMLLNVPEEEIEKLASPRVSEGIRRVREARLQIVPGYDGVFGKINIFAEEEKKETEQKELF
ncbi:MAG: DNA helicase UvrD [Planctomycetes bacterium DG_23]|nr:MAG: DNA helicase UvrD [Planctomycetes bacterium DG_23]